MRLPLLLHSSALFAFIYKQCCDLFVILLGGKISGLRGDSFVLYFPCSHSVYYMVIDRNINKYIFSLCTLSQLLTSVVVFPGHYNFLSSSTKSNLDDGGKRRKYDGMGFHDFLPTLNKKNKTNNDINFFMILMKDASNFYLIIFHYRNFSLRMMSKTTIINTLVHLNLQDKFVITLITESILLI